MNEKNSKVELKKVIILAIVIILLIILSTLIHKKNYDINGNSNNITLNVNEIPIDGLDTNKIEEIYGIYNVYYYDLEDYEDFQAN